MNIVVVRTKLQAIIVLKLLACGVLKRPFCFVTLHQYATDEDDEAGMALYRRIAASAALVVPIIQARSVYFGSAVVLASSLMAALSGGRLFAATINYYPLALAVLLNPWVRLVTFDDGNANIYKTSLYFMERPIGGYSWTKRLLRVLFPRGAARFCRDRVERHYTIYPGVENIVPKEQVEAVAIDWEEFLSIEDRGMLARPVGRVMLGTPYHEIIDTPYRPDWVADWAPTFQKCDIYLPHPREKGPPVDGIDIDSKRISTSGPAEAVIHYLLSLNERLIVDHFASSTVNSFAGERRLEANDVLAPYLVTPTHDASAKERTLVQ